MTLTVTEYIDYAVENLWDDEWQAHMENMDLYQRRYPGFKGYTPRSYLEWSYPDYDWATKMMIPSTHEWNIPGDFVEATLFHDNESNISLWTISIGRYDNRRSKDFLSKGEAQLEWISIQLSSDLHPDDLEGYYDNSNFRTFEKYEEPIPEGSPAQTSGDWDGDRSYHGYVYMPTRDEWYGTHRGTHVRMLLCRRISNLDLWSIGLYGTDDYSLSKDILGGDEAKETYRNLLLLPYVNKDSLPGTYFSN